MLFIGFPRSGSSLVGALLDAHPDMVVSHEMDALKHVGFSREQIYYLIMDNARRAAAAQRSTTDYVYAVPHQWQGRWRRLRVIGDKQAGGATLRLAATPGLLDRLRATVAVPLGVIQVVRNPFDNISTICRKFKAHRIPSGLDAAIEYYLFLCDSVEQIKKELRPGEFFSARHERMIEDPRSGLQALCRFLGVEADESYLADGSSIVHQQARRTRFDAEWTPDRVRRVEAAIRTYPFLKGYRFER